MRIKCFILACLLIFGIACFSGCNKSSGVEDSATGATDTEKKVTYISSLERNYTSIDELYESADLIIKGTVTKSTVEFRLNRIISSEEDYQKYTEKDKEVTTVYTVEISEVYKGEAGDTIDLLQLGGEYGDEIWIADDAAEIDLNTEYVMFLGCYVELTNSACLLNSYQSLFSVNGETLTELSPDFGSGYDNLLDFLQSKQS